MKTKEEIIEEIWKESFNYQSIGETEFKECLNKALTLFEEEILEKIDEMMNKKEDEIDVKIWGEELKKSIINHSPQVSDKLNCGCRVMPNSNSADTLIKEKK
jgi:hypothetical protein